MEKIYTCTGDNGITSLYGGVRVKKTDPRIKANALLDHVNCSLGLSRSLIADENRYFHLEYGPIIKDIQIDLMKIMALIASSTLDSVHGLDIGYVDKLERLIDDILSQINVPDGFVIPGTNQINALMHIARVDVRNAEIELWELKDKLGCDDTILKYINRLSDLLFVMAVSLSAECECWKPSHPKV